jgi:hypothetical protein
VLAVNALLFAAFEYKYVYGLVFAGRPSMNIMLVNVLVYSIPWIVALALLVVRGGAVQGVEGLTWRRLIVVNATFDLAYAATFIVLEVLVHRTVLGLPRVFQFLMFEAPHEVNKLRFPIRVFEADAWISTALGLIIVFTPLLMPRAPRPRLALTVLLVQMLALLWVVRFRMNTGMTPFLVLVFVGYLAVSLRGSANLPLRVLPLLALAPLYASLVAAPDVAYLLLLTLIFVVLAVRDPVGGRRPGYAPLGLRATAFAMAIAIVPILALPGMAGHLMRKTWNFQAGSLHFRSADWRFTNEISTAAAIDQGNPAQCAFPACTLFIVRDAVEHGRSPLEVLNRQRIEFSHTASMPTPQ